MTSDERTREQIEAAVAPHLGREPDPRIIEAMAADPRVTYLLDWPTPADDLTAEYRLNEDERRRDGESTIVLRSGQRERALAAILTEEASNLPRVSEFRQFVLGNRLMARADVPKWVRQVAKDDGDPTLWALVPQNPEDRPTTERDRLDLARTGPHGWRPRVRRVEKLTFIGTGEDIEAVPVNAWGDLGLLKTVAEDVGGLAHISEPWAVEFVLTGRLRIPQVAYTTTSRSRFPALDRLNMSFSLSVPTSMAAQVHREALAVAGRPPRMRDIDVRHAEMAILAHHYNDGRTWGELYELYMRGRSTEETSATNFDRDCRAAYRKVTGQELKWKNERGRPPKTQDGIEERP